MKILQFPLARITIAFVIGILFAYYATIAISIVFLLLSVSVILFIRTYFLSKKNKKFQFLFGISVFLLSFSIGITTLAVNTDSNQRSNYTHYKSIFDKKHTFAITLREKLRSTAFSDRYIVLLNSIDNKKASGRMLLNVSKDSTKSALIIGNQLKLKTLLSQNTAQKNPNQFDYRKYLENKQIYAQLYAEPSEIQINSEIVKDIWYYTAQFRNRIIQNLEKSKFNTKELNVAVALIMGQQQDIDQDIIQDYQYAGAVHILSVSGLHIGFILLFITFALKPFPNTRKGAFIKLLITLTALFLFGVLAGLAPSVVRSVTMFSFVAVGQYLRRSVNIYHTLLVSILLILLFQPYFLFDVGFQLSYLALFFIVWLQPFLANSWKPNNKIIRYFWDILTVSFAAQIGTLPLSIYYFHQFPGLFFVTNMIILPLMGFIMGLGVLVMVLALFNWVPFYPAKILELSIYYLDKTISIIASQDQFIIKDIPLNSSLLISSYLAIITLITAFQFKTFKSWVWALITIIILQLNFIATRWNVQNQNEFVILNIPKNTLLIERNGNKASLFTGDTILKNTGNALTSYLTGNFSTLKKKQKLNNLLYFKGKKILLIDSSKVYPKNAHPDILILIQSPKINFERLLLTTKPKIVVADASNYKSVQKRWKAICEQQKIPFHSTGEKGFYLIN